MASATTSELKKQARDLKIPGYSVMTRPRLLKGVEERDDR